MKSAMLNLRFSGVLMVMGPFMVALGFLLRPVQLQDTFDIATLLAAHDQQELWIWSFRILVFGLFMQVMGLVATKSLLRMTDSDTMVAPGTVVCSFALLATALSEGYYMHMGAWAGWKMSTLDAASQGQFLQSLESTHEWVICITRMGYMFFCLGLVPLGWGIMRSVLFPKWLGIYALILGMGGMMVLMVLDSRTDIFVWVRWGFTLYYVLAGVWLLKSKPHQAAAGTV